MIVPMKKVTLLCLGSDRANALDALQALGVMHLSSQITGEAGDRQTVKTRLENLLRLIGVLEVRERGEQQAPLKLDGRELADYAQTVIQGRDELTKALHALEADAERLTSWGDFDWQQLNALQKQGVHVYLCESTEEELEKYQNDPEIELVHEFWWRDNKVGYAVVTLKDLNSQDLPLAFLPEKRLAQLEQKRKEYSAMLIALERDLDELVASVPKLKLHIKELQTEHDFLTARDSMEEAGEVAVLHGFIPAPEMERLQQVALTEGWALDISDPSPEDRVPTLLKFPRWAKTVKPLFDFLGIMPGYTELDVSAGVFVFFSIFFGMIINDAGYGLLFLGLTLWGRWKYRDQPAAKLPLSFMMLLSVVAVIWGALGGSYFGLSWGGLPWLTEESTKNQHIQLVCFILGLIQLTLGRIWQAFKLWSWRKSLGQLGWALVLVGNFIIVVKLLGAAELPEWSTKAMYGFYGAGLLLVVIGAVNWLDVADVFQFPFSIIGSFVDILSYIRLFAVGLSGYYIALNFNEMALGLVKDSWWMAIPCIIVIFLGHALNISLCLMGVLVHGVRLNTLEFSNHVGLTWSGVEYKPLQKTTGN